MARSPTKVSARLAAAASGRRSSHHLCRLLDRGLRADIIDFLTNVECVEGRFDTFGTQGKDFTNDLLMGGPTSKGFAKANLSPRTRTLLEEVALSEQVSCIDTLSVLVYIFRKHWQRVDP